MQDKQEKCKELAIRIYNLDEEVYKCVGSSLGRTFTGQKETTLRHLAALMYTKPDGHLLRSELALISNMALHLQEDSEKVSAKNSSTVSMHRLDCRSEDICRQRLL